MLSLMDGKGMQENREVQNSKTHALEYRNSLCRKRAMVERKVYRRFGGLFFQFFIGKCKGLVVMYWFPTAAVTDHIILVT